MDIILLKDYDGLGEAGDVVNVKPGYARNKLIPEGVALRASKRNLAIAKERKRTVENRREREGAANDIIVKTLTKTEITIEAQVGEEDKMFGSVTAMDIQKSLKEKGIDVPYMVKDDEGHGFYNQENQFDFYREMEKFLQKHIG